MNLSEINIREKEFHNNLQSGEGKRSEGIFYRALYDLYKNFYEFYSLTYVREYISSYLIMSSSPKYVPVWTSINFIGFSPGFRIR